MASEAQILHPLHHPHISRLCMTFEDVSHIYRLVSEMLEGGALDEALAKTRATSSTPSSQSLILALPKVSGCTS